MSNLKSIMVIGDDAQSIYAFRHAVVQNMTEFDKKIQNEAHTRKITHLNMTSNYRSFDEILEPANELIRLNKNRIDKPLVAARGKGGVYFVQGFFSTEKEQNFILNKIKEILKEGKYKPNDIAVIARTKKPLLSMQAFLTKNGIQATLGCPTKVLEDSRVQAAIAITEAFFDPNATMAYKIYLNAYCMEHFQKNLKEMYPKGEEDPDYVDAIGSLEKKFTNIESKRPALVLHSYHELLEQINFGEMYQNFLDMLYEEENKQAHASSIDPDNEDDIPTVKLRAAISFISDFKRFGKNTEMKLEGQYDGVTCITAHSSKGLEYPIVFCMTSEFDNSFLHSRRCALSEIEETRRLLFVSMTRAKDQLYVTGQFVCFTDRDGYPIENRFLKELYSISGKGDKYILVDPEEAERKREQRRAYAEKARARRLSKIGGSGKQMKGQMHLFD
jgi:DNA helicase-2/ATP-dependent DNA helicase PcrA